MLRDLPLFDQREVRRNVPKRHKGIEHPDLIFLPRMQDLDANLYGTLNTLVFVPIKSGVEATGSGLRRFWK